MFNVNIVTMIATLQYCKDKEDLGELSPKIKQHIDGILVACAPMLYEVAAVLQAQRYMSRLFELQASIREECMRCSEQNMVFDGKLIFETEQHIPGPGLFNGKLFDGPLLRADTREEADIRASVLGLKVKEAAHGAE